jgi:hypothetical protein
MGGTHGGAAQHANGPANLLALCRRCHDRTEDRPLDCRLLGWLVPHPYDSWLTPAYLRPIYGEGWWFLLPDLSYRVADEASVESFRRRVDTESVFPDLTSH